MTPALVAPSDVQYLSSIAPNVPAWSRPERLASSIGGALSLPPNVQAGFPVVIANDPSCSTERPIPVCCEATSTAADAADAAIVSAASNPSAIDDVRICGLQWCGPTSRGGVQPTVQRAD